jgi:hypothetical protein
MNLIMNILRNLARGEGHEARGKTFFLITPSL